MEQMALVCVDLPGTLPAPLHDDFFISRHVPSAIEKRGMFLKVLDLCCGMNVLRKLLIYRTTVLRVS
jgi:hypothetical protein